jgi:hypothetical protein
MLAVWGSSSAGGVGSHERAAARGNQDRRLGARLYAWSSSVIASLLFGLAPALHASRVDLNDALKQGGDTRNVLGGGSRTHARCASGS